MAVYCVRIKVHCQHKCNQTFQGDRVARSSVHELQITCSGVGAGAAAGHSIAGRVFFINFMQRIHLAHLRVNNIKLTWYIFFLMTCLSRKSDSVVAPATSHLRWTPSVHL